MHDLTLFSYQGAETSGRSPFAGNKKAGPRGAPGAIMQVARGGDKAIYGAPNHLLADPVGLPTAWEP